MEGFFSRESKINSPTVFSECSISASVFFFTRVQSSSLGVLKERFMLPSLSIAGLPFLSISVVTMKSLVFPTQSGCVSNVLLNDQPFSSTMVYHVPLALFSSVSAMMSDIRSEKYSTVLLVLSSCSFSSLNWKYPRF